MDSSETMTQRFSDFFAREVAIRAASPLAEGIEIAFKIKSNELEEFVFTRREGKNTVLSGSPILPQLTFTIPAQTAEDILANPSEDIGTIGVNIVKMMATPDASKRIAIKLHCGFMELFTKGYFGVLAKGGQQFAGQLAAMGLSSISTIKDTLKNMRG